MTVSLDRFPDEPDGRRRRSQDSRARIVEAMFELVREGEVAPGAESVAARAGVGLRTVFRQFKDMESLYGEIAGRIASEVLAVARRPLKAQNWRDRLAEMIERRAEAFDAILPFRRAAECHRHTSPVIQAGYLRLVEGQRELLKRLLPETLTGDALVFEALDLALSYEAWSRLRDEQGLSSDRAKAVLNAMTAGIVGERSDAHPDQSAASSS